MPRLQSPPVAELQALIDADYSMPRLAIHYRVSEPVARRWCYAAGLKTHGTNGKPRTKIETGIGPAPELLKPSAEAFRWLSPFNR